MEPGTSDNENRLLGDGHVPGATLGRESLAALQWSYAGTVARAVSGFLVGVVLARLLGPEPFGIVAMAMVVIGLGRLIADFGFGAALVQADAVSDDDIRFVFTWQVLFGLALSLAAFGLALPLSELFREPELVAVLQALSPLFLVQAIGQTAAALLRRRLALRLLQAAQVGSHLLGFLVIGMPLAVLGFGVWSLVVAQLVQFVAYSAYLYLVVRHPIGWKVTGRPADFITFGGKVMASSVMNWAISNLDTVAAGRAFGSANLGLYNRAMTLVGTPTGTVVTALQGVLFPAYSRAQGRTETLRRVYLASLAAVSLATAPVFLAIALVPATTILGVYGSAWRDAVPLVTPLALAMVVHATAALAGPLVWGVGRVELELGAQMVTAVVMLVVLAITSTISLTALAWGVLGVYAVRALLMTTITARLVGGSAGDIGRALRGSVLLAATVGGTAVAADLAAAGIEAAPVVRLLAVAVASAVSLLAGLRVAPTAFVGGELRWLLTHLEGSLARRVQWFLRVDRG